jgi:hypothetical protein
MNSEVEESYILREYFKGFLPDQGTLLKIKDKINKINREHILSYVVEQNKDIYKLISENYQNTYEIIDKITGQIDKINKRIIEEKKELEEKNFSDLEFKVLIKENYNNLDNNKEEPISIKKINEILFKSQNKIQEYKNNIIAKKNVINKKLKNIKNMNNIYEDYLKDKDFFIENIEENINVDEEEKYINVFLIGILFTYFLDIETSGEKTELIKLFNKKSKKEIKKVLKLINDNNPNFHNIDKLQKIKKQLNTIKSEMNEEIENSVFYFLYKSLINIVETGISKINISIEKDLIETEKEEINKIEKQIKSLNTKIAAFEKAKEEIRNKYNNQKKNNLQIMKQSKVNKQEEKVNNVKNSKDELNKLKLLIGKMENNYVNLLKNLSKKIIKPKNLIIRPDDQFLQSKIK